MNKSYKDLLNKLDNYKGQLPYNLVITSDWMFIVLRKKDVFMNISCNALSYLGLFYVDNDEKK